MTQTTYRIQATYYKRSGKLYTSDIFVITFTEESVREMTAKCPGKTLPIFMLMDHLRNEYFSKGKYPGLVDSVPPSWKEFYITIDFLDHPEGYPCMIIPPMFMLTEKEVEQRSR